jgi:Zn2+/Cd2+-exporting ATPase
MDSVHADWHECRKNGTVIHLAEENCYLGHIVISDTIKSNAADAIAQLKKQGVVQTVMLTGDTKKAAEPVARELGIDMLESDLLPGGKVACIESLLGKDSTVAFIGDGINDAPVLMRSDVGIAMGAMGSDAAIESADVVIMDDNISRIPLAMQIARKTMRIVHQNIFFAIGVKFLVIGLGAFGLAGLWAAVFADVGVMLIAVINSLRALRP